MCIIIQKCYLYNVTQIFALHNFQLLSSVARNKWIKVFYVIFSVHYKCPFFFFFKYQTANWEVVQLKPIFFYTYNTELLVKFQENQIILVIFQDISTVLIILRYWYFNNLTVCKYYFSLQQLWISHVAHIRSLHVIKSR